MADIALDGSYLEGGGQILRNALALSCLTGKSFSVHDIRKGRKNPGLKAQHLYCVKAAAQLTNAEFSDVEIGSSEMEFFPKRLSAATLDIDIGTAGSITLFLQSVLIPSIFANAPVKIIVKGGTDGKWSMPFDYFREIFLPYIRKFAEIEASLLKRGYYPKGGGKVELNIKPLVSLSGFGSFDDFYNYTKNQGNDIVRVKQGKLLQIKGFSHAAKALSDARVAERQAEMAQMSLKRMGVPVNIEAGCSESLCPGSGITLWAKFDSGAVLGADALGERGKSSEVVGKEASENLVSEIEKNAPVDSHLADNLIPFIGLFGGRIKVAEITNHALTNIYVTEKFLDVKFEVDEENKIISV